MATEQVDREGTTGSSRAESTDDSIRLVALSGYGQDTDIPASLAAGFEEHLTKPPDPDRLDRLLRR